ncbi:DUF805 domain-containing protein [Celeribacter indicus]|uniref:DUF805 domain-containing protein n=1 Tax=Celeribacter indicus TaxID=1208324 RepID=A0A0B5E135_9RHOB|nr:DUF805 domain-containing protein [Celeribacter indicus]AJE48999.1 hypothetical protein P73_4284 [Celeribacter indicus]SDW43339.1 Uncharacterized membrane protein YhaH, DUF805 family [Celeribacter indicus]
MGFLTAIRSCFEKYVTFSGRARRAEYWWWALFVMIGSLILGGVDTIFFGVPEITGPTAGLFSLLTFLPGLAVWVRRLHDVGRSGWWVFLIVIPLIGWIVLLVWAASRGDQGANRYGADPVTEAEDGRPLSASGIPPVERR